MKLLLLLLLFPVIGFSQLSRSSYVYIHIDKTLCYPGDTIRFSGYAIKDKETNLYCELYTSEDTVLIKRLTFPLVSNKSEGSIVIPKRSGYYWLVFHTFNSKLTVFPLSVMTDAKVLVARKFNLQNQTCPSIRVKADEDSIEIHFSDTVRRISSVSITDLKIPISGYTLIPSSTNFKFPESNYIEYTGSVARNNGKHRPIRNQDLVAVFSKDSATRVLLVPIDTFGNFKISNLYFTDTGYINYQLNLPADELKDIALNFKSKRFLEFYPPTNFGYDTISYIPKLVVPDFIGPKYLTPVTVKVRWQDRNKGLNTRYTTGIFTSINSPYNFNVMDTSGYGTKWCYDLFDFLKRQGFDTNGKAIGKYFIDEQERDSEFVRMLNVHTDIAYVKYMEDMPGDHGGLTNWLVVYTRQGKDLRSVPGKMNQMLIVGYSQTFPFINPDRITSLWIPDIRGNTFKIKKISGVLTVQGIDEQGVPFFYRTEFK